MDLLVCDRDLLAYSLYTDVNYGRIYSNEIFEPNIMLPFITFYFVHSRRTKSKEPT